MYTHTHAAHRRPHEFKPSACFFTRFFSPVMRVHASTHNRTRTYRKGEIQEHFQYAKKERIESTDYPDKIFLVLWQVTRLIQARMQAHEKHYQA